MKVTKENLTDTTTKLTITADQAAMDKTKAQVLSRLGKNVRVQGFRAGRAPQNLIEKQLDPGNFQSEFLDAIVNQLYIEAVQQEKLRPVVQPSVSITKFVPFSTLEFTAEVETVGKIVLPDYKKIKIPKVAITIVAKDVDEVIANLRSRAATKEAVTRAAKTGDQVTIDFVGTDAKTKEVISGADGNDYPLLLGSKNFIPGFEENLVGMKPGGDKTFDLTFPKDYNVASLQNRQVTFSVTVKAVDQLIEPKIDDAFAATVGPFKTVADLKADIKKQLKIERQQQAERDRENELLEKIAEKTTVTIPEKLIEEEIDRIEEEEKRNLVYRGQTWQEHLDLEGVSAEEHRVRNRPGAELRVKAGLVLAEAAERESITVSTDEIELRMTLLRGQYADSAMQAELDKPDSRRDISSRLLTEKTIQKLLSYATPA